MQPRNRSHQQRSDDTARFLHELRALRDTAGLDHAELAAKAHYPTDLMQAAEAGPALPDWPVISAYVRACGGMATEWEDRWRSLTDTANAASGLPVRAAGTSTAAAAGARAGGPAAEADEHDRLRIMAALNKVAARERVASSSSDMSDAPAGKHQVRPVSAQPATAVPASNVASIETARKARAASAQASKAAEAADEVATAEPAADPAPFPDVNGLAVVGEDGAAAAGLAGTAIGPDATRANPGTPAADGEGPGASTAVIAGGTTNNGGSTANDAQDGTAADLSAGNGTATDAPAASVEASNGNARLDDSWPASVVIKPGALPWTGPQPEPLSRNMPDSTKVALITGAIVVIVALILIVALA